MRAGLSSEGNSPLTHLVSGFVGEGYCADVAWLNTGINEGSDSVGNNTGFAAAGSCDDKKRTFKMEDGFCLRGSKMSGE